MAEHEPNARQYTLDDALGIDLGTGTGTGTEGFMNLRVPDYAYMYGFLQADGHLARGPGQKGSLTVEINVRDIDILRAFQRMTPYSSSITERTRSTNFAKIHHSATWTLCSLAARTRINELGLPYGRKSVKIAPPRVEFSHRDYLRGIIDADGSVGCTAQGFPFVSLTTASTAIATYLCSYVKKVTGAERSAERNARDGIYNILYMKETAQELSTHLYYPGCLSLERKRAAATSLGAWLRPAGMKVRPPHTRWTRDDDRILLEASTPAKAAIELNRSPKACAMRRWRLNHGLVPLPD